MELIKGFRLSSAPSASGSEQKVKQSLTIGLIGHPNVGKSSLINTLKRSKACSVAPTPGWTKEVQEVVLEKGVRVLDCPGVVVEARGETEGALRGMVKPEDVRDPKAPSQSLALARTCGFEELTFFHPFPSRAHSSALQEGAPHDALQHPGVRRCNRVPRRGRPWERSPEEGVLPFL